MGNLDGRIAIVTGAAQGIGKAIADKLAEEGAKVVVADLNSHGADAAAPAGGLGMQVDISKEDDVRRMVDDTVSAFGELDVLVNNASIVPFTPWDEVDFAEWRRIMAVNLDGTFLCCHHAQRPMRDAGYGRIVNIASNVILAGTPNLAHYVASKGGVFAFTRALAREAVYDDPLYATLVAAGARISLAEQGHPAEDRPGVEMAAPADRSRADVVVVLEVDDARAVYQALAAEGASFLAEPYE